MPPLQQLRELLERGEKKEIRALFAFDRSHADEEVRVKFNLWLRYFFPGYVMDETKTYVIPDAPDHARADLQTIVVYRRGGVFVDIEYRGAAKTTRKKLFLGFAIANDTDHYRKYIKVLAEDDTNSEQAVTDIYNFFVERKHHWYYPEMLVKTPEKRVERMGDFETATGVKVLATTVGVKQRGQLQDEYRPDLLWFDDFESRVTLRSAVTLQKIWDNMEEARTGLSLNGGAIYTCNFLSERGNVYKLITKYRAATLIVPIKGRVEIHESDGSLDVRHIDGPPTWPGKYTPEMAERLVALADDAAGEYLSCPAAGGDVLFPRDALARQEKKKPIKEIAGFKIFHSYDPSHRFGSGHDVGGGVGLDSSTSVFIDFTQFPNRVVATFKSNTIKPDIFGDEIHHQTKYFGRPLVAPENNKYDMVIGRLKQLYDNIYTMKEKTTRAGDPVRVKQWGWNTNSMTKPEMLMALRKAVADGHLELSDPDLIAEARSYSRDDLMDKDDDPRLATRHFDLLMACAIAWQMRLLAEAVGPSGGYEQAPYEPVSEYEGGAPPKHAPMRLANSNPALEEWIQPPYEGLSQYEG